LTPYVDGDILKNMDEKKEVILNLLSGMVKLGASVTSFWLIYLVFCDKGIAGSIIAFIIMATIFRFGPAPLFAVSASVISFYYHEVGIWLPVASYILAVVTLIIDIRSYKTIKKQKFIS
jgi:uncharacterized membrane protein